MIQLELASKVMEKKISPGLIIALPRSGTNWVVNVLKSNSARVLNEPLWLHNREDYITNPLHPLKYSSDKDADKVYLHKKFKRDPYGVFLLKNFFSWLTFPSENRHIFKETDGFFHLEWLYTIFPSLKTLFIKRDIRGNISSFERWGLYERWNYQKRMQEFRKTIYQTPFLNKIYGEKIPTVPGKKYIELSYYFNVAILEIERNLKELESNKVKILSYENLVLKPKETFAEITDFFGLQKREKFEETIADDFKRTKPNNPFDVNIKKNPFDFERILTAKEIADIKNISNSFNNPLESTFYKSANKNFSITINTDFNKDKRQKIIPRQKIIKLIQSNSIPLAVNSSKTIFVHKFLIPNIYFVQFLYWLNKKNIPITIKGKEFFYNLIPESKIYCLEDKFYIKNNYENHPATHMNFLSAFLFCLWAGGRLPFVGEWKSIIYPEKRILPWKKSIIDNRKANFGLNYGGTTPINFFNPNDKGIYDPVGNTGVWLNDHSLSLEKPKAGGAWSYEEKYLFKQNSIQKRPWWLSASTVGIRPVFDIMNSNMSDKDLTKVIEKILEIIKNEKIPNKNKEIFLLLKRSI